MAAPLRASGLASGIDSQSLIDSLVSIERSSITKQQSIQSGYKTKISTLGDLTSKLSALNAATQSLKTNGVLGVKQVGTAAGFTATPGSAAPSGRYALQVDSLAQAAKARSAAFASGATVTGGTLTLGVNGTNFDVTINDGATLDEVAGAINDSDAPVTAAVLTSGTDRYLSITNRDVGFTVGNAPATALTLTETSTGTQGRALGLAITTPATNAKFSIDGLPFERASNSITDAIPGVTLGLTKQTTLPEDLVLSTSTEATQTNLQKFADAFNDVMKLLSSQLSINKSTDRNKQLGGDGAVRSLQASLTSLGSKVIGSGSVRTLADLGLKTGTDGTLTLDAARLGNAIATDSAAVNAIFQNVTSGIGKSMQTVTDSYTNGVDGLLVLRKQGLEKSVNRADKQIADLQYRLDKYQERLQSQFAAMEKLVSGFKSIGNFLTQQENNNAKKG